MGISVRNFFFIHLCNDLWIFSLFFFFFFLKALLASVSEVFCFRVPDMWVRWSSAWWVSTFYLLFDGFTLLRKANMKYSCAEIQYEHRFFVTTELLCVWRTPGTASVTTLLHLTGLLPDLWISNLHKMVSFHFEEC